MRTSGRLGTVEPGKQIDGPQWVREESGKFGAFLSRGDYPCNFGRTALLHGNLYSTWVEEDEPVQLPGDVRAFVRAASSLPKQRQPLAVFVRPRESERTQFDYDRRFWSILAYLLDHDDRPWPENVPQNPAEPGWQFCFAGQSIFVFALTPLNRRRLSRNLCDCLVLVFQLRSVFTGIEVGTTAGDVARQRIRARLAAWDEVGRHPSMGDHDELSDDEWRQYFLTDSNEDLHSRCPLAGA